MRMHKFKRLLSFIILFATLIQVFSITGVEAKAAGTIAKDANELQYNYINLMKGGKITDASSVSKIANYDDLRNMAVFLSNAFVPYYSSLDGDSEEANKEMMCSMLGKIGFDSKAAKELTDKTYKASLDSATQLWVKIDDLNKLTDKTGDVGDHGIGWINMDDTDYVTIGINEETYTNAKYISLVNGDKDEKTYTPLTRGIWDGLIDMYAHDALKEQDISLSIYYKDSENKYKKCCILNNDVIGTITFALAKADQVETNDGSIGNCFLACGLDKVVSDDFFSDNNTGRYCILFQNMYVDWVGNILADFGDQRVVILPACLNPMVLTHMDGTTGYNLTSVLGTRATNIGATTFNIKDAEDPTKNSLENETTITDLMFVMIKGDSEPINADSNRGFTPMNIGGGESKSFMDFLFKDVSAETPNGSPNEIHDGRMHYKARLGTKTTENAMTYLLKYASVENNTVASSEDESVIETFSLLSDEAFLKDYFSVNPQFTSDELSYMISFNNAKDGARLQDMFLTYTYAYIYKDETSFDEGKHKINLRFNDIFPTMTQDIVWEVDSSEIQEETLGFIYYLLHPTKGIKYVTTLIKNKISGLFVGWHEDIVGATDSNSSTGMTKYLGFSGYTTTPSLYDIEWVAKVLNIYDNIVIYVIILLSVILLCYVLVGSMTLQRGFIGLVMFSALAFLPPIAINTITNISNITCEKIYSSKFDYWALCQMQTYLPQLDSIENAGNTVDYIAALYEMQGNKITSEDGVGGTTPNSYTGVRVKWLSPKKFNDMAAFSNEISNSIEEFNSGLSFATTQWLVNGQSAADSSESYVKSDTAGYVYRDLLDIYRYSSCGYNLFTTFNASSPKIEVGKVWGSEGAPNSHVGETLVIRDTVKDKTLDEDDVDNIDEKANIESVTYNNLYKYVMSNDETYSLYETIPDCIIDTSSQVALQRGFLYNPPEYERKKQCVDEGTEYTYYKSNVLAPSLFLNYCTSLGTVHDNYQKLREAAGDDDVEITVDELCEEDSDLLFGIPQSKFTFALNEYLGLEVGNTVDKDEAEEGLDGYYYSLYSESPYYFFNYNLRDQFIASGEHFSYNTTYSYGSLGDNAGHVKNLLLNNNQEYFYNINTDAGDGYGELRDFMNFHDLFYYIIPSLQEGNDLVNLFDRKYGLTTYEDCNLQLNADGKIYYNMALDDNSGGYSSVAEMKDVLEQLNEQQLYRFWHDYNVRTVYNCYTSWLNLMSACEYADTQTINIAGEKFTVLHPLDPTSYYSMNEDGEMTVGRYMVFSRSEMAYYGLSWNDLTTVEQKIINVQDSVYKKAIDLMNYYTFSDETLLSAYSMLQLFEFNEEFSQNSLLHGDVQLYPQGYELKAFTYDAYLRLIVSESSGESLMTAQNAGEDGGNESIYRRVLEKTSIFFGILLIINDFLAVYVIPGLRIFFLIVLFFLSIVTIVGSAVKLEMNLISVSWKCLLAPMLCFAALSIGMAYLVSLFMSEGAQGVLVTSTTISMGDPTMVVLVMCVINAGAVYLYWKICKKTFKDLVTFAKTVAQSIGGNVAGALRRVTHVATAGKQMKYMRGMYKHSTAKQRAKDNDPASGKAGFLGGMAGGLLGSKLGSGGSGGSDELNDVEKRKQANYNSEAGGSSKGTSRGTGGASGGTGASGGSGSAGGSSADNRRGYDTTQQDKYARLSRKEAEKNAERQAKVDKANQHAAEKKAGKDNKHAKQDSNVADKKNKLDTAKDKVNASSWAAKNHAKNMMNKDLRKGERIMAGASMLGSGAKAAAGRVSQLKAGASYGVANTTNKARRGVENAAGKVQGGIGNAAGAVKSGVVNSKLVQGVSRAYNKEFKGARLSYQKRVASQERERNSRGYANSALGNKSNTYTGKRTSGANKNSYRHLNSSNKATERGKKNNTRK